MLWVQGSVILNFLLNFLSPAHAHLYCPLTIFNINTSLWNSSRKQRETFRHHCLIDRSAPFDEAPVKVTSLEQMLTICQSTGAPVTLTGASSSALTGVCQSNAYFRRRKVSPHFTHGLTQCFLGLIILIKEDRCERYSWAWPSTPNWWERLLLTGLKDQGLMLILLTSVFLCSFTDAW